MYPSRHIFFGLCFTILLHLLFPVVSLFELSLFFLSSFLIDTDHYLYYVIKKRDLRLNRAYKWFVSKRKKYLVLSVDNRKKYYSSFCFFHGIESILFFVLLGIFFNKFFLFIAFGMLLHLILDLYEAIFVVKSRIDKISIIYDYFKLKSLNPLWTNHLIIVQFFTP